LAALAHDGVALKPDLLVAVTRPAAEGAKKATSTIPIVFVSCPIPSGLGWWTGRRIRTNDRLLPKQMRYQTALRPEPSKAVDLLVFFPRTRKPCPQA
jgi:hypothetical protein